MALSKGDEYPLHQTPEPVAQAGTDRNFYDRYFFNGYGPDGEDFFALAFGVYPQLGIADAHFSIIRDGVQHSCHASRPLSGERLDLSVGAIRIEIVEPLKSLRLVVDDAEGLSADIVFTGRSYPIEEPRFTHRIGPRAFMDYTRMTQNGRYKGWISLDGEKRALQAGTMGTRDRSWGTRPIGARDPQPIPFAPLPSFFWQWTPINLPSGSVFFHLNAEPDGTAWNTRAVWVPEGGDVASIREGEGRLRSNLLQGTRWPGGAELELEVEGAPQTLTLEPVQRFQMNGLGYTHPEWNHGLYHGDELVSAREELVLDQIAPLSPENLHVQIACRVRADAGETGFGVFEQLAIGPYEPLGLTEFLDGGS